MANRDASSPDRDASKASGSSAASARGVRSLSLRAARREDVRFAIAGLRDLPGGTAAAAMMTPPDRIGAYQIERVLGRGGMSIVYGALQTRPRRRVAIKMLRANDAAPNAGRRVELEAEILAKLHHPGIAQVFESGTFAREGRQDPYFVMEYIDGRHIDDYRREGMLATRQRLELVAEVCDAVEHAHSQGILHRDLKPSNILVESSGRPRVLDFGVARATTPDLQPTSTLTLSGQVLGTAAYMSPEQCQAPSETVDARSDVYSLGVLTFQLLSGRLPRDFAGIPLVASLRAICEQDAPLLGTLDRGLRGDVESIVAKALEGDRERRYGTAGELAADIRRFLRQEPVLARRPWPFRHLSRAIRRRRSSMVLGLLLILTASVTMSVWRQVGKDQRRWVYNAAITQLSSSASHETEAGIRTLEGLARDYPGDHRLAVLECLCSFLRNRTREVLPPSVPPARRSLRADFQIALEALVRVRAAGETIELDLTGARLDGAFLRDADFSDVRFAGASLINADFSGSHLERSNFGGAILRNASLVGGKASAAVFMRADLSGQGNPNDGAAFDQADLANADFRHAVVADASFTEATMNGALGWGADWTKCRSLTQEQMAAMNMTP